MAVYKSIYCYPFSENANLASVFPYYNTQGIKELGEPFYLSCRVDSSNKNVIGYSIKIYDDGGAVVFPPNGAEPKISPVEGLPKFVEDATINSGINGTYLKIPFFQEYDRYQSSSRKYAGSYNALYCNETAYYTDYFMVDLILAAAFPTSITGEMEPTVKWDNCWNGWNAATWSGPLYPQTIDGQPWDGTLNGVKVTSDHVIAACVYSSVAGKNEWHLFRLNTAGNGLDMIPDPSPSNSGVEEWIAGGSYRVGSIVVRSNTLYKALHDVSGSVTPPPSDPSNWEQTYWPALAHACFVRYGNHAGIYSLDPNGAIATGGVERLQGFWFPATGGDPIPQFLMDGSSYTWEITLYQGPQVDTVDGLLRENDNSGARLQYFWSLYDIDIFKLPGDWFDMSLGQGKILGSNASRLQLADLSVRSLPGEGVETVPVLQGAYASIGYFKPYYQAAKDVETSVMGVWNIDSENFVFNASASVSGASMSLGHAYLQDGAVTEQDIADSQHVLFYKYSSNEEEIYERDMVKYAVGTNISLDTKYEQFAEGDRVLLIAQVSPQENGVYLYYETPLDGKYFVRAGDCSSWASYIGRVFYAKNQRENYSCSATAGGTIDETPLYFYPQQPIKLFNVENNPYFHSYPVNDILYDFAGNLALDKDFYIGHAFSPSSFKSLTSYGMPQSTAASGNYIAIGLSETRIPTKGDVIALSPTGTGEQFFRVLRSENGIATLMGLSPVTVARFSSTDNKYEGSYLDGYLNRNWTSSFTSAFKSAMLETEISQDSWYHGNSGNPVYTGINASGSSYQRSLGENAVGGRVFSRYVYALSVSDVIEYLDVAPSNTMATSLTAAALQEMFGNAEATIFFRSCAADDDENVMDLYPATWQIGRNLYSRSGRTVRPVFRIDLRQVSYRLVPAKGDVIWLNLDGTERKYRVLGNYDNFQTTKLFGLFSIGDTVFGARGNDYLSGNAGLHSVMSFWNLTSTAVAALSTRVPYQYGWSLATEPPASDKKYLCYNGLSDTSTFYIVKGNDSPHNPDVNTGMVAPLTIEDIAAYFGVQASTSGSVPITYADLQSLFYDYSDTSDRFWLINNDQSSTTPLKSLTVSESASQIFGSSSFSSTAAARPVVYAQLSKISYRFDDAAYKKGDVLKMDLDGTLREYLVLDINDRNIKLMTRTPIGFQNGSVDASSVISTWLDTLNPVAQNALVAQTNYNMEQWWVGSNTSTTPVAIYFQKNKSAADSYQLSYIGGYPRTNVKARRLSIRDIIEYCGAVPDVPRSVTRLNPSNFIGLWGDDAYVALENTIDAFSSLQCLVFNKEVITHASIYNEHGILAVFQLNTDLITLPKPASQTKAVIRAMAYEGGKWKEINRASPEKLSCYLTMPNDKAWDGSETPIGDQFGGKSRVQLFSNAGMICAGAFPDPTREQLLSLTFAPLKAFVGDSVGVILKNSRNTTYISPNQNIDRGHVLKLLGGKTVSNESGQRLSAIRAIQVDKKFWSVTHVGLASPYFISYETSEGTPFNYDVLCGSATSAPNAFTDYTIPFLAVDGVSSGSASTDSSTYKAVGNYYQGQSASWESYRFLLKNAEGEVLQDTGEKYDKEMKTWFLGLDADNVYYVNFVVTDNIGYRTTYEMPLYTSYTEISLPYSDSFADDRELLTAELDCSTHSVLIKYNGETLPEFENGTLSLYRREAGLFTRPACDGSGRTENAKWYGDWHPVAINTDQFAIRDFNVAQGHSYQYAIFPKDLTHAKLFANQGDIGFTVRGGDQSETVEPFYVKKLVPSGVSIEEFSVRDEDRVVSVHWDEWALVELVPEDPRVDLGQGEFTEVPAVKKKYRALYENMWLIKYDVEAGSLEQNMTRGETQTLGQYDRLGYSPKNLMSGSISCYLGSEIAPLSKVGYTERPRGSFISPTATNEATKLVGLWRAFAHSSNPKLLTDRKGQKWIVQIMSTSVTPQESYVGVPCKISFNWKQIDSCDDNIIVYGEGEEVVSPGSKPEWRPIFDYGRH